MSNALSQNKVLKTKRKFTFTRKWFALPMLLFVFIFVATPLVLMFVQAFLTEDGSFTLGNFAEFFKNDGAYLKIFGITILVAAGTTVICLLIAYPVAYFLARKQLFKNPYTIVLLFIIPMWINFMLRIYALREFLTLLEIPNGWGAIMIGMVYDFLPFMILPLYNSLRKMDMSLIEAAKDLGANNRQVFFKTVIPLSMPGVISGITMVFVPVMSAYAVSDTLSGNKLSTIGRIFSNLLMRPNIAAAFAIILSIVVIAFILLTSRYERIGDDRGGTIL